MQIRCRMSIRWYYFCKLFFLTKLRAIAKNQKVLEFENISKFAEERVFFGKKSTAAF